MNRKKIEAIRTNLGKIMITESVGERTLFKAVAGILDAILEDEKTSDTMIPVFLFDQMSRIDEVRNYARFHDITVTAAIERLVNSGLSHEHRGWTS